MQENPPGIDRTPWRLPGTVRRFAALLCLVAACAATAGPKPDDDVSPEAFFRLTLAYGRSVAEADGVGLAACDRNNDGHVDERDLWDFSAAWLARQQARSTTE
jgi:hypothetical protein